jgi:transposase
MSKKKRRTFSKEQKADAVELARTSGKSYATIAGNLGIGENSLRLWVRQADIDEGKGPSGALTTKEKAEIRQLKRDLKRVTMERDFLKKAAAYFAKNESESSK